MLSGPFHVTLEAAKRDVNIKGFNTNRTPAWLHGLGPLPRGFGDVEELGFLVLLEVRLGEGLDDGEEKVQHHQHDQAVPQQRDQLSPRRRVWGGGVSRANRLDLVIHHALQGVVDVRHPRLEIVEDHLNGSLGKKDNDDEDLRR